MTTTAPSAHDLATLTDLVARLEQTQRTEDADGFLALFDPDAIWVSGGGIRLVGRDAIAEFTRKVLPGGMAGMSVSYEIVQARMLSADVAMTSVDQEYLDADGARLDPRERGRPTYIWQRDPDGDWLMIAGQNTGVDES